MAPRIFKLFRPKAVKQLAPTDASTELEHARVLHQQGRFADAAVVCRQILGRQADHLQALMLLAEIAVRDDPEQAALLYAAVLEIKPNHAPAHYKRGNLFKDRGELEAALASYDQAIALDPGYANAFCNRGVVLARLRRWDAASDSYDQAIALNPADAIAYYNRGGVLCELKRWDEALASYDQALKVAPGYAEAYCNRGTLLEELAQWDAALASYDRAIEINSGFAQAYFNRGALLQRRIQWDAALASYDRAIEVNPHYADAYCNRGILLMESRQWEAALASLDRAIALKPDLAEAHCNRGQLFAGLMRTDMALANFDRAVALKSDYADAYCYRADLLVGTKRFAAAIASYDQAIIHKPDGRFLLGARRHAKMHICDWADFESDLERISVGIEADTAVSPPLPVLALLDSPRLQQKAAQIWVQDEHRTANPLPLVVRHGARDRIRLGYFSGDFCEHPVALLMAELFEMHDRSKYEVIAFSSGPDTGDNTRKRIEGAFERFVDVRGKSDQDIALLARSSNIDIAVDLGGHTASGRPRIFALRAAPVQVSYLGYPGTMGAEYIDYLIADRTLIPVEYQRYYSEKIIYLPSFQANDSKRPIADRVFTRDELDLPPNGFVFCCFNASYKITPGTFDSWMRILTRVPDSVLLLYAGNDAVAVNLRKEAGDRGIEASRLVFGGGLSVPEYLARYRAADLFLDTLPYNAGTTASDALWAGLPVLTCAGASFAGRMAASLLQAIGLPELIAATTEEYENLAVHLATDSQRLGELKRKLAQNRLTAALFDTRSFTRHLEAAYSQIHGRYRANLPPKHIYVQQNS